MCTTNVVTQLKEKVSTCSTLVVDIREVVSILEMVAVITTWRVDELLEYSVCTSTFSLLLYALTMYWIVVLYTVIVGYL